MSSIQVFLSDTHFGVRNNSISWLESQKDFIYNQFIPYLKKFKNNNVTIIHLGDVFDSRSSISPMICKEANQMLEDISKNCDEFIIIAGNHDFFSPIEGIDNSTSLEMLPCRWIDNNIKIVYNEPFKDSLNNLFIPWFDFHNIEKLKKVIKDNPDSKNVFTHTDIAHLDEETLSLLKGKNIFTGHIHIPMIRKSRGWFTLGSCYYINFQDANSERGFYTLENWDINTLKFYPNEKSIRFHRIVDEEILNFSCSSSDYIELSIKDSLYERLDIQEKIKEMNSKYQHFTVVIKQQDITVDDACEPDMGIYSIVNNHCKENLRDKLKMITEEQ